MAQATEAQRHFERALASAAAGRRDVAIAAYREALRLRPAFFEAQANLGNLLQVSGRHAEAIPHYRSALEMRPGVVPVLNGLGLCELAVGRPREAATCFEAALAREPGFASGQNNLGNALAKLGELDRAITHLQEAVRLRPDFAIAWINLGEQLYRRRDDAPALQALDRALALDPANESVHFLRKAIAGESAERAPDAFVREFFDRFAGEFDARLVGDLEYATPQRFIDFISPHLGERRDLEVADLGCGTGLSGLVLRAFAARLVGVDLSAGMLERARVRGVYDELHEAEITAFLQDRAGEGFDLVSAVDVFVYVGNLAPVMQAAHAALAPGGLFGFSVEEVADAEAGYVLSRTGRYAHAQAYVEDQAARHGFVVVASQAVILRKEAQSNVEGRIFALRRT